MISTDPENPNRSIVEKWIRFKLDAIGALGEKKGNTVAQKARLTIIKKRLNPVEAMRFMATLRKYFDIPTTPEVLFMPRPSPKTNIGRQMIAKGKAQAGILVKGQSATGRGGMSKSAYSAGRQSTLVSRPPISIPRTTTPTVVSGDMNILPSPSTPYEIDEVVPAADIILGDVDVFATSATDAVPISMPSPQKSLYPFKPVSMVDTSKRSLYRGEYPGGSIPNPRPHSVDSLYPYMPTDTPLNKDFVRMDNLGTLLPPRPVMKPWQTAKQKLFQPGDYVIHKQNHAVGQIKAIKGEEVMVSYGRGKYAHVPMQELAIYYGTVRKLKRATPARKPDLGRMVGHGRIWKSPKVIRR